MLMLLTLTCTASKNFSYLQVDMIFNFNQYLHSTKMNKKFHCICDSMWQSIFNNINNVLEIFCFFNKPLILNEFDINLHNLFFDREAPRVASLLGRCLPLQM